MKIYRKMVEGLNKLIKLADHKDEPHYIEYALEEPMLHNGDKVRCAITGFEGIIVSTSYWLEQAITHMVAPITLKDGVPMDNVGFDEVALELIEKICISFPDTGEAKFHLGDLVRSKVDGYVGMVTGICFWNTGCIHYHVMPTKTNAYGDRRTPSWLSGHNLILITANTYTPHTTEDDAEELSTGGPVNDFKPIYQ